MLVEDRPPRKGPRRGRGPRLRVRDGPLIIGALGWGWGYLAAWRPRSRRRAARRFGAERARFEGYRLVSQYRRVFDAEVRPVQRVRRYELQALHETEDEWSAVGWREERRAIDELAERWLAADWCGAVRVVERGDVAERSGGARRIEGG
ncbi:MAG: hypothetical protein AAF676_06550 [Pseudomonadota bacterium]